MDTGDLDELNYMLMSGSDRIGALDFQTSPRDYVPRLQRDATLQDLLEAADAVERGLPLSPELEDALRHGTSIGGARPKAQLIDKDRKLIAKFSSARDTHNVVCGEYLTMRLARMVGLRVAPVEVAVAEHKDVLLVERFDRVKRAQGWLRKAMVSGLTVQGLDELGAFGIRRDEAIAIAVWQLEMIHANFRAEAAAAGLNAVEQDQLARRAFLNPYIFERAPAEIARFDVALS